MFDPAVLGTLLIGLDSTRSEARPNDLIGDAEREIGREATRPTDPSAAGAWRNGSLARLVGTLLTSLQPRRAGYEKNQRR